MKHALAIRLAPALLLASLSTGFLAAESHSSPLEGTARPRGGQQATLTPVDTAVNDTVAAKYRPRKPKSSDIVLPVDPVTGAPRWNGRLWVKFRDDLQMRADRGPVLEAAGADGRQYPQVAQALRAVGGTIRQAINRPVEQLQELRDRAQARSNEPQPDLASMMFVDVSPSRLLDTARLFNDLDIVDWVAFDQDPIPDGGGINGALQYGCGQAGDIPTFGIGQTNCYTPAVSGRCTYIVPGAPGCNDLADCQDDDSIGPNCKFGCNDTNCCDTVAALLPYCSDEESNRGWDAFCATLANIYCGGTVYGTGIPYLAPPPSPAPLPSYRMDPCFALRGPVDIAVSDIVIQGDVMALPAAPDVPGQLVTYTLDPATGNVDPASLALVVYPTNQPSDEALASVASQAMIDPSLEGVPVVYSADCFTEHSFGGCYQTACCVFVCRNDPACCLVAWDNACIGLASEAASLVPAPCSAQALPPDIFQQDAVPSPLLTGGVTTSGLTPFARGYQTYTQGAPVLNPTDTLPADLPPGTNFLNIPNPSVRANTDTPAARNDIHSQLGTVQFLQTGYRGGGLDLAGFENLAAQLGIPPSGTRGAGVTVAVIEHSAYVNHEDLVNRTTSEPGQTQVLIIEGVLNPNHGTAVLGIIGAENNNFGITGIAHEADLRFYPTVSREEGSRLHNAIVSALIDLEEGDVINMSIGFGGGTTIPGVMPYYSLISVGTALGITTVCSAGNDSAPVITVPDDAPETPADSGAIIVGACWPGFQTGFTLSTDLNGPPFPFIGNNYCRLPFSNFTDLEADRGGEVHVAGWGVAVAATGYGVLFRGTNASNDPLQVNQLRSYTGGFSGTSAAAPVISGAVARAQCFANAYFGTYLPPDAVRAVISQVVESGNPALNHHLQCGISYASPGMPGYPPPPGTPRLGDNMPLGAGGLLARIGPFPRMPLVIARIVTMSFGGVPVNYSIITGQYISGSPFSIRQLDGNVLKLGSVRKQAGTGGNGFGPLLVYPLTGDTTDVQITLDSTVPPDEVSSIEFRAVSNVNVVTPVVCEMGFVYNAVQNRWKAVAWGTIPDPICARLSDFGDPREFVVTQPGGISRVYARAYTCGLAQGRYQVGHDQLVIVVNQNLLPVDGGCF